MSRASNSCPPLLAFWVISLEWTLKGKACAPRKLFYPKGCFDDIWHTHIPEQGGVSSARTSAPPPPHCWPFELSPLSELYRGKLVRSITLKPFEFFWWYLVYIYIRSRWCGACKNGCSPCCPFEVFSLNELYRGQLVHSITIIPFDILWWYLVYIIKSRCVLCKSDCSLLLPFCRCLSWINLIGESLCAQ